MGWDLSTDVGTFVRCTGCLWVPVSNASQSAQLSALSDGIHVFEVMAVDAAGNEQPPPYATVNVTIDTVAPSLAIQPVPRYTNNGTVTVCLTAIDSSPTTTFINVTYGNVTAVLLSGSTAMCGVVRTAQAGKYPAFAVGL